MGFFAVCAENLQTSVHFIHPISRVKKSQPGWLPRLRNRKLKDFAPARIQGPGFCGEDGGEMVGKRWVNGRSKVGFKLCI